ncbi:MAG: hypothetical protein NZ551_11695 [Microscillaceae bacterium]|nr:hypothetical protein [Microscillaceae bacterium]MDW8461857.1 hypothetical protein [Cytophagales bacterium]
MIYDCFAFFNELDLLEIRLHELDSVVDKFVLVEATRTFQKKAKPLYFQENKARFAPFLHKIEHIIVSEYPTFWAKFRVPTAWDYDNHQKEHICRALTHCQANDIIIISDLDEIPKADKVAKFAQTPGVKVFEQRFYNYYLNCICTFFENKYQKTETAQVNKNGLAYWRGSVMLSYKDFQNVKKTRLMRDKNPPQVTIIEEGGWHFSFLGGVDKILEKLQAWAHTEAEYQPTYLKDKNYLLKLITQGEDLFGRNVKFAFTQIDHTYPIFLQQNLEKFQQYIK